MCKTYDELQRQIDLYQRALRQPLDPLSAARISAGILALQEQQAGLHPKTSS